MHGDILRIYENSLRLRQKLDADQDRFAPKPRRVKKMHEPRWSGPGSEFARVLAFLRNHLTTKDPAGPVTIWYRDGKPYKMTEAEKVRAAESEQTQRELEAYWSTWGGRRRLAEIEHATAARKNTAEDLFRRYGILVDGEVDWSTQVHALRKIGKPLKDFLEPVYGQKIECGTQPANAGEQPNAYIADLAKLLDLVGSRLKRKPGYWRRAQSLDLRSDRLCGLPGWLRESRQQELALCDSIDEITRIRLYSSFRGAQVGSCFCIWHGAPIPYYAELRAFYPEACRPRFYCALSRRPEIGEWRREKRDFELAAAKKNREMVQRNGCAEYFLGVEPHSKQKAHPVQDRGTLGDEAGDSEELAEILRIARSEAKCAVRGLLSGPSSFTIVKDGFFDDLYQEAAIVALTETRTDNRLPLDGAPLRRKIRSRLKREIGRLRMRDYHYGEGLPDTDGMTAEEDAFEMLTPSTLSRFAMPAQEAIFSYGSSAEERAEGTSHAESTEMVHSDKLIDSEEPPVRPAIMALPEEVVGRSVVDLEKLSKGTLAKRELAMVVATYEGRTEAEIGEALGCHQSTVQRALKKIAGRATLRIRSHPPEALERAPSTRFLPSLDPSAY